MTPENAGVEGSPAGIVYSEHEGGDGEAFRRAACQHGLEGVVSKRTDRQYLPGDRGAWVKSKCLNRAEFVVVGWSGPEGSRPHLGALLLGYYNSEGRLIYAGRVGTGMSVKTLAMLHERLAPLATSTMPLSSPAAEESVRRPAGPLQGALGATGTRRRDHLSRLADEPLLRHTVFVGLREDKPAREVRRETASRP